jgi:catalase
MSGGAKGSASHADKIRQLDPYKDDPIGTVLSTDQGLPIPETDDSLKAGERGPTLLEDFHFREKLTQFDHERIPERVVHARGSGAHGHFQVYEPLTDLTKARFLQDPSKRTPVFVRFSTVVGSRGSADTVRDVRGFATKFYTEEGNFDLVGNNIPVFFIQDGIKFPDLVHAIKPEPHNEIPQAASAHDTFWDFVSLVPETIHMVLWVMSDRAIPRSFRMMEGFGVHTFRMINEAGDSHLVKFHWKPLLGAHSLVWDEAQKIAGKDPDFHRRDLWEAIEKGHFPEFELGLQVMSEEDVLEYGFDLLDPTKIVPEEVVPVRRVGKLTLDRNPDNFFAETEQIAFCVANVVPGIDFTEDPLMQARLFSYLDTQLSRLGGPNFEEIPINRPLAPVHNYQQDGHMRQRILKTQANYTPNSIAGGCPFLASAKRGFSHFPTPVTGNVVRRRSPTFADHFSQASLFYDSLSAAEQRHLIAALQFELGKVERKNIRQAVVDLLASVDMDLARTVAEGVAVDEPAAVTKPHNPRLGISVSPSLSLESSPKTSIATRKIAVLVADGVSGDELATTRAAIEAQGAEMELIAPKLGIVKTREGDDVEAVRNYLTAASVLYDAVFVPGGKASVDTLKLQGFAERFVAEAYRHAKPIGASGEGVSLLQAAGVIANPASASGAVTSHQGVVTAAAGADTSDFATQFIDAIRQHRFWDRPVDETIPA